MCKKKCTCKNEEKEENPIRHDLVFRRGGVGLKPGSIDYAKVVEKHYDFLLKLAGIKPKDKDAKEKTEKDS